MSKDSGGFINPSEGWTCTECTYINTPGRPGCEICSAAPPESNAPPLIRQPSTNQTMRSGSLTAPGYWECHRCTYKNEPKRKKCEACETIRPTGILPENASMPPYREKWVCSNCNFGNDRRFQVCQNCGRERRTLEREAMNKTSQTMQPARPTGRRKSKNQRGPQWQCPACTFINKMTDEKCGACRTERPATATGDVGGRTPATATGDVGRRPPATATGDVGRRPLATATGDVGRRPPATQREVERVQTSGFVMGQAQEAHATIIQRQDEEEEIFAWTCASCRKGNNARDLECVRCHRARPEDCKVLTQAEILTEIVRRAAERARRETRSGPSAHSHPLVDGWKCEFCETINQRSANSCQNCFEPKERPAPRQSSLPAQPKTRQEALQQPAVVTFDRPPVVAEEERFTVNRWVCAECGILNSVWRPRCRKPTCGANQPPITEEVKKFLPAGHWALDDSFAQLSLGNSDASRSYPPTPSPPIHTAPRPPQQNARHIEQAQAQILEQARRRALERVPEVEPQPQGAQVTEWRCNHCFSLNPFGLLKCGECDKDKDPKDYSDSDRRQIAMVIEYEEIAMRDLSDEQKQDVNFRQTVAFFKDQIRHGRQMLCPQCKVVLEKDEGCDWIQCAKCKTEVCWAVKDRRWGRGGVGDVSGGCRCGVDGIRCVPYCKNCH